MARPLGAACPAGAALAGATAPGTREAAPVASARGSGTHQRRNERCCAPTIITSTILGFAAAVPLAVPFPALAQGRRARVPEGTVSKSWPTRKRAVPVPGGERDRLPDPCQDRAGLRRQHRRQDRAGEPGRGGDGDAAPRRHRRLRRHELRPRVPGGVHGHLPPALHAGRARDARAGRGRRRPRHRLPGGRQDALRDSFGGRKLRASTRRTGIPTGSGSPTCAAAGSTPSPPPRWTATPSSGWSTRRDHPGQEPGPHGKHHRDRQLPPKANGTYFLEIPDGYHRTLSLR